MKRRKMLSILLCAALLFSTAPVLPALAADEGTDDADMGTQVGMLSVCGGTLGEDFTYDEETHVLAIEDGADLTISGETGEEQIVVKGMAHLILDGVSIVLPNESGKVNYEDKNDANAGIGALTLNNGASLTLTLSGENTLQSGQGRAGIFVPDNASLTIDGEGSLDVTGGDKAAGIGGDLWHNAGAITIESGSITATGGTDSAGIGGAHANDGLSRQYGGFNSITIEGGDVTAIASGNAAGIGTGCWAKNGGAITITDATVSASTSGTAGTCAAIGHGYNGGQNLTKPCIIAINGSIVSVSNVNGDAIATGGTDSPTLNCIVIQNASWIVRGNWTISEDVTIEERQTLVVAKDSVLTIQKDMTLTNKGVLIVNGTVTGDGKIVNKGDMTGNLSGVDVEGTPALSSVTYLDAEGTTQILSAFIPLTTEMHTWSAGWYVALGNVTIDQRVATSGDVHLILADGATLTVNGGINLEGEDNNLTIYGQSTDSKMGRLIVQNVQDGQAGIGTRWLSGGVGGTLRSGTIIINGGHIEATGGNKGAGIGSGTIQASGRNNSAGEIVINGGSVTAIGGGNAAGIGCGANAHCSGVTITGGHVTAVGTEQAAGIGKGFFSAISSVCHGVTVSGGSVFAFAGQHVSEQDSAFFSPISAKSQNVTAEDVILVEHDGKTNIESDTVTMQGDAVIPAERSLTISAEKTLVVPEGVTLTVEGNLIVEGTMVLKGTLIGEANGQGTIHQAAGDWQCDDSEHWRLCSVEGCDAHVFDRAAHTMDEDVCSVCGYVQPDQPDPEEPDQPSGPSTPVRPSGPDSDKPGVEVTEPEHGTVTVDKEDPAAGETVTITPTPDEGYEVDEVIVRDEDGDKIPVSDNGDGSWSYEQPDGDVTIEVSFTEIAPTTPVSEIFIDVAPDAWYTGAVQFAYDRGLMTGTGADTFSPDATTTRAMIVAILHRLEEEPAAAAGTTFDDVAADAWYADAVAWAADVGIVNGYSAHAFGPNDAITREQLAAILMNYSAWKGEDTSTRADLSAYSDAASVSAWAADAMGWAVEEGLIKGMSETTLVPEGSATRAQVAAILERMLSE